jgi:hypothetical protein
VALSLPLKSEGGRLSADSPDPAKKKGGRRPATKVEEEEMERGEGGMEGQPPKKRGKGKGKAVSSKGDATGPKRVFVCPHCQVRNFCFLPNLFHVYFFMRVPMKFIIFVYTLSQMYI